MEDGEKQKGNGRNMTESHDEQLGKLQCQGEEVRGESFGKCKRVRTWTRKGRQRGGDGRKMEGMWESKGRRLSDGSKMLEKLKK